jgi:predicted  nucleic acid-binding Zn-ribbon protein
LKKECFELKKQEISSNEEQIKVLSPTNIEINMKPVLVKQDLIMSLVGGGPKVCLG